MLWLTGGSLVVCIAMIAGLLALVASEGLGTFWPRGLVRIETRDGRALLAEVSASEAYEPTEDELARLPEAELQAARDSLSADGTARRRMLRVGNYDLTGEHYRWVSDFEIAAESRPEWALVIERQEWGRFQGFPQGFRIDGEAVADTPEEAWKLFEKHHPASRARFARRKDLEKHAIGRINRRVEAARLRMREAELDAGEESAPWRAAKAEYEEVRRDTGAEYARIQEQIKEIKDENARYELVMQTADETTKGLLLSDIVRAYPANRLGSAERVGVYLSRWWEFLSAEPREANSEGGVLPAIFGTVAMTLIMSIIVVPFGVLAALYLREYARQGALVSAVRIAVNNLAGVPSIVFGVFGLGFFCYIVGGAIDASWFRAKLPTPTYGTGGLLWSSLTLALLTLPVVIVATEEALAAVPNSMREGSYACGATRWQTIRRIVLPRAAPGIMTGMILAIARGAGEVAPLMLVGAVKLAPELPIDGVAPFLHPERSFMHLGFHIFDLGFQSANSEAAKPMVYTTTLLLIAIVVLLNVLAILVRARLRRRFRAAQ